jgi:N-acetylneuraminic acid mutarotase
MKKLLLPFVCILINISFTLSEPPLTFNNLTDMPTARGAITSAANDGSFYVSNGFSSKEKFTGLVEKYDIDKNNWSVLTSSLIPKQFASSAIIGNSLYVFNGDLSNKTLNKKMEVVNTSTGEIKLSKDNPQPARAAGVAVWGGNIYFFGGKISYDDPQYSNALYKFDPSAQKWTKLANMPEEKETKGVIVNGKLYTIGGYNGKVSDRINVYDINTDKWTELAKLPSGISANSVVAYGTKIFSLFDFTNQAFIGCYDIPSNKITILQQNNMIGRRHAGAHIQNDKLYIMGGNTGGTMNSCLSSLQVADLKN